MDAQHMVVEQLAKGGIFKLLMKYMRLFVLCIVIIIIFLFMVACLSQHYGAMVDSTNVENATQST